MPEVSIRELRNRGGDVIDRVERGERMTVTRSGRPVAELVPIRRAGVRSAELVERWRHLPPMDPRRLREDVDALIDTSLS